MGKESEEQESEEHHCMQQAFGTDHPFSETDRQRICHRISVQNDVRGGAEIGAPHIPEQPLLASGSALMRFVIPVYQFAIEFIDAREHAMVVPFSLLCV